MQYLDIVMRILHVGSAIALLGGTLFFLAVAVPALRVVEEGLRSSILLAMRKRFYRVSHPALLLLIVTGFYSFARSMEAYRQASKAIHPLLGTKILLALVIVFIVFGQTFGVLKGCPKKWATINLCLGIVIVILAVIVRSLRVAI